MFGKPYRPNLALEQARRRLLEDIRRGRAHLGRLTQGGQTPPLVRFNPDHPRWRDPRLK